MTKKRKASKTLKFVTFGILNAYGDFWATMTFRTPGEAETYMKTFWGIMENPPDMSKHEVVPVTVTYRPKKKPNA